MEFPQFISFTITNACNLRCKMCGQWSDEGYVKNKVVDLKPQLKLDDWKRLVDEISKHKIRFILVRGGEPFLYPGIIELLEYINSKGIFVSVDTNGTIIEQYIPDLLRIGNMHITFSVDGPESIHDSVRGMEGSFNKIKENLLLFDKLEKESGKKISRSICFTISKYSYKGLGEMPEVARSMCINSINIVPYYFFSSDVGKKYEDELKNNFDCTPFSWKGFHHNDSGIDIEIFRKEHEKYLNTLDGIENFPYFPLNDDEYKSWFEDPFALVKSEQCTNIEKLIDIQSNGDANFCIDFPDYIIGNVNDLSISQIWNGERAEKFRNFRRKKPLAICYKCGAKYCSEIKE